VKQLVRLVFAGALASVCFAAVRGKDAMYVGGTIDSTKPGTKGKLDVAGPAEATFHNKKTSFAIPFGKVTSIEYGQKAGRRLGVALVVSPLALLSKKRRHYLTVGFADAGGTKQGAVFELAKGTVRSVVSVIETRSGKKVEFESEDARKHFEKN
jgi:hypothetical protein